LIKKYNFLQLYFSRHFLVIKTLNPDPEPEQNPDSLEMRDPDSMDPDRDLMKARGACNFPVSTLFWV
jgi:hypothetical protein